MKLKFSILILFVLLIIPMGAANELKSNTINPTTNDLDLSQSNLPFSKDGTITENGNDVWDLHEIDIIGFNISAGQNFTIELFTSVDAELWVLFGDFNGYLEAEEALRDIDIHGESSLILAGNSTTDGYVTLSYTPSSDISKNIAIFTYIPENPASMDYTLYSTVEGYSIPAIMPTPSDDYSGYGGEIITFVILSVIGLVAIYIIYKKLASAEQLESSE